MLYRSLPLVLALVLFVPAAAAADDDLRDFEHHVRTGSADLRALIRAGYDGAPSFRALVEALTETDVLVYVEKAHFPHPSFEAGLRFMSTAGGRRYLKAEVNWTLSPQRQLAAIAHELQHALEIAESPGIVSGETLANHYHSIGWEREPRLGTRQFESRKAIDVGNRVYREYMAGE